MLGTTLPKLVATAALAVTALGATSAAQAGTSAPPPSPSIIGVLGQGDIIAVLKGADIIGVLEHPDFVTIRKGGGGG